MEASLSPALARDTGRPSKTAVTVIMPVRNEAGCLDRTLGAVLSQDYPRDLLEVIVADGSSDDGTRAIVSKWMALHANLRLIDNPERIVPTALNRALRQARGDVIVRVDGHTVVAPDYVSECVEVLHRSGADTVGGPMRGEGAGRFGRAVVAATSSPFGVGGARFHYSDREEWVDTVYMGAWRRPTLESLGGFDEEMVRDQDDELNYRILDRGGRVLLSPRIRSVYTVRGTPRSLWRQYFQYGFWKVLVARKHPRQIRARQVAPPTLALALVASALGACMMPADFARWGAVPALYVAANLAASAAAARRAGWGTLAWMPWVYGTLHLAYGFGALAGLAHWLVLRPRRVAGPDGNTTAGDGAA